MERNSKKGRRYDAEFTENAVALVQLGRTLSEVARALGCGVWTLMPWFSGGRKARFDQCGKPNGPERKAS